MHINFITISKERESPKLDRLLSSIESGTHAIEGLETGFKTADGNKLDIFRGYQQEAEACLEREDDYFAFVHDDVCFLSNEILWKDALERLSKPLTGVVGVAGTQVMPKTGVWWQAIMEECRGAVYHPSPGGGIHQNCWPHTAAQYGKVVIVDGLFMMISRRNFFKVGGFKHPKLAGFHGYDLLLSTRCHLAGLSNYVVPLPILHDSVGQTNNQWDINRQIYLDEFGKHLPLRVK